MQFRRRIKIAPGVQLNLSKGGISVTVGTRGMHYTFGRGKSDISLGLPGTGMYYRKKIDLLGQGEAAEKPKRQPRKARHNASHEVQEPAAAQEIVPPLPPNASVAEQLFHDGALAYLQHDYRAAFDYFSRIEDERYLADELLMTG